MRGSLLEVLYARAGFVKGARVGVFVIEWALCTEELGHDPGMEEFAAWAKESRATVYRRQAEFREVLPEWETPAPFAGEVRRRIQERESRVALLALAEVGGPGVPA